MRLELALFIYVLSHHDYPCICWSIMSYLVQTTRTLWRTTALCVYPFVLTPVSPSVGRFSKQAFLQDVPNPHDLVDGTPSFMDFMGNRNNRFTTPEAAQKNNILCLKH